MKRRKRLKEEKGNRTQGERQGKWKKMSDMNDRLSGGKSAVEVAVSAIRESEGIEEKAFEWKHQ